MRRKQYERTLVHALTGETLGYIFDTSMPENVWDTEGGRWVAACARHSTLVNTRTLGRAADALMDRDFCEQCVEERGR